MDTTRPDVRLGVIGLGMMGRNHARIAARLEGIDFVGGVDPAGDQHRSLADRRLYTDIEDLLEAGVDAAVVAVPSTDHEKVATRLAESGVHTLIEKPLASDVAAARRIARVFEGTGLVATVGHVERFNPALQELKSKLDGGFLGQVFSIRTRRVGPYPLRVQDVGVIKDLATHDIDLALWLGGRITEIHAQTAHKLGRPYEDLVEAVGTLDGGAVLSISVNWLTPAKKRSVTVLGERGALVADLLSADLTFFANADVPLEWDEMARLRGVSEGDTVRYALRKREPLQVELENFRDAIRKEPDAQLVHLDEGVEVLEVAERLITDAGAS